MNFPTLSAVNLDGRGYTVPTDLSGEYNAVVIAFQQRHQVEIETWQAPLNKLAAQFRGLNYYILPTTQYLPGFQNEYSDIGMQLRLNAHHARENTLQLYVDLNDFNRALDIPTVSQIYTLLLDRVGQVLWRASGAYAPEKAAALSAKLERLYPKRPVWVTAFSSFANARQPM